MYSSELSGVEMYTFTYIHRSMHLESGLKSKCLIYMPHVQVRARPRYSEINKQYEKLPRKVFIGHNKSKE